ncbi:molybdopterin-binding protein [Lachnospiraceae bacterium LCP25S3_G4]
MQEIRTEDAVGHVLCHDITQIIRGQIKDAVFRKGHIITKEDIPILLSVGKEHLFVWEQVEGMLHEDEAAETLKALCQNHHMESSLPKEGKIELKATCDGLFKVNTKKLEAINELGEIIIATRHGNTAVKKGDKLAAMRVIPLVIREQKIEKAVKIAKDTPLLELKKYHEVKVAIIATGSEVYHGRIKDTFSPVVKAKVEALGGEVISITILDDDPEAITKEIRKQIQYGAEMVLCTGGMSVDPDDRTPLAIRNTGAKIITYGAPVLPGAMFLLANFQNQVPIVGLPGCVMYAKQTIFDLALPRLMVGEYLELSDFTTLGEGGLCLSCESCMYPNCGFGK